MAGNESQGTYPPDSYSDVKTRQVVDGDSIQSSVGRSYFRWETVSAVAAVSAILVALATWPSAS